MRKIAILLGFVSALAAQTVRTTVDTAATDNSSFRVLVTADSNLWIQLKYGTSTGAYPFTTKSIQGTAIALAAGGLAPATTYHVVAVARPNPNDDLGAVASAEFTITTLAGTLLAPQQPTSWSPAHPDTSRYTVIPINVQYSMSGECGAKATVTSPDGWTVHAGDTIPKIIGEIGYGTVLEFEQGAKCVIPYQNPVSFQGYTLAHKPIDPQAGGDIHSSNHRYIVFRTKSVTAADFPPYGVRTTPAWSQSMAKFYIQQPTPKDIATGQGFDAEVYDAGVHHFWFENLEFAPSPHYTNPVDAVDPVAFQYFFRFGSQYQNANNSYLVLDRLYMHGWPAPIRQYTAVELGGNYQAMIGCYLSNIHTWRLTAWPTTNGILNQSNTVLSVPQSQFRFNVSSPTLGMSGAATVSLSGLGSGSVIGNLYKDHLEIQYSTPGGTVTCIGCSAMPTSTPSIPVNAYRLFDGTIVNGKFSAMTWYTGEYSTSQYAMAAAVMFSDLKSNGGPYLLENNYMDGVGEAVYVDPLYSNFAHDNLTYSRNHNIWPKNFYVNDAGWAAQGWRFDVRQPLEWKRGHSLKIVGNIISNFWSYQNDGPAIFLSGRPSYSAQSLNSGISDVTVQSNIIRHGRTGISCMGVSPLDNASQDSDPEPTSRISLTNNLMYDMGRDLYCDTQQCPAFDSPYFVLRPGCQNVSITNNTGGIAKGAYPAWLMLGGGTMLSNYLDFRNNVLYLSAGAASHGAPLWGPVFPDNPAASAGYTNHDVAPSLSVPNLNMDSSFTNVPNWTAILNGYFTKGFTWSGNVAVGGYFGAAGSYADLSASQVAALAASLPPGTAYPAGNSIAARESAIHFANATAFDYRITAASASASPSSGVDFSRLYADNGMVTNIQAPNVGPTFVQFSYQAPDARACYVDLNAVNTSTWTRTGDGGGPLTRNPLVAGLTASKQYRYRILCYFEQQNDGVLYTEYTPDQMTEGTFSTTPGHSSNGLK